MRQILVISSHVAYGTIGLTPMVAPLQQAGIEVTTLPTPHVRITVGLVRDGFDELGRILAEAARTPNRLHRGTR